jgi:ribosomal protein S18 acetylase RimI-like enzyme
MTQNQACDRVLRFRHEGQSLTCLSAKVNKGIRNNSNAHSNHPVVHFVFSLTTPGKGHSYLMPEASLRLLRPDDLQGAMELSRLAGWNQTIDDWQMLLRLEPEGCFAIELDNRIVATTTLLCYGTKLAWIGMVLTRPEYRRRGLARRLMEAALGRAAALKIESVKLDATSDGRPLYEKLGFKTEQIIERWFRDATAENASGTTTVLSTTPLPLEIDIDAFGADRSILFQELATRNRPHASNDAFCFSRNGSRCNYLGPCVAKDPAFARGVIEETLKGSPPSSWYWDLLNTNKKALGLAAVLGFVPQRRLERMSIGHRLTKNDQMVYAIAGFELG